MQERTRCQWHMVAVDAKKPCRELAKTADPGSQAKLHLCSLHLKMLSWRMPEKVREVKVIRNVYRDEDPIAMQSMSLRIDGMQTEIDRLRAKVEAQADEIANGKKRKSAPIAGVVYIVRVGAFYKIGWASDLANRMKAYPPDSVLMAVMPGTRKDETQMHRKFAHVRSHGREWYPLVPQINEQIASMVREHGEPPASKFAAQPAAVPMPHRRIGGPKPKGSVQHRA